METDLGRLGELPRVPLCHAPTPFEAMPNLAKRLGVADLYVKRDDCTGLAFGGNKVRQLEFYLGAAQAEGADTLLISGAVQSNFVRLTAAAARKLGLACHIQLEERVPETDSQYRTSGNVLLDRILGATIHEYAQGEDEAGADRRLGEIARELAAAGRRPYIIPLGPGHRPLGALGYLVAAREILDQTAALKLPLAEIVIASGSGNSHAGLLFGLRALGSRVRVTGVCVRRPAPEQGPRIAAHCRGIAELLDLASPVDAPDICLLDGFLAPGYGQMNQPSLRAIALAARCEGLILDPVYTGKAMAGLIERAGRAGRQGALLFVHTGGTPALFAYGPALEAALSDPDMG